MNIDQGMHAGLKASYTKIFIATALVWSILQQALHARACLCSIEQSPGD